MAIRTKSISENNAPNWKQSLEALRYLPRFFREIYRIKPKLFLTSSLSRVISGFLPVVMLWLGKLIIDEVVVLAFDNGNLTDSLIWHYVALEFGLALFSDMLTRVIDYTDGLLSDWYNMASSISIMQKTNEIEISDLEDSEYYDKLERARTQTARRVNLMTMVMGQLQSIISIVSLILGMLYFEPWLMVLLGLSLIPLFLNELKYSRRKYSLSRSWTTERRELDYLRYIGANDKTAKEVKLYGLTDFLIGRFGRLSETYLRLNMELNLKRTIWGFGYNILGVLSYYGAYLLVIYRVVSGSITVGELTFLAGSFRSLRTRLQSFFSRITFMVESSLYLRDYFDFLDLEVGLNDSKNGIAVPEKINQGIRFENVHFSYPGSKEKVLDGVSFDLPTGTKLAFVGKNGAGKTTMIKLILRFYEPTQGRILLDGIHIKKYDKTSYQQMFGVLFQEFIKYEFTLGENIGVGNVRKLNDIIQIKQAAELSLASQVEEELDNGFNQQLGKRFTKGIDLSGGQWQKVALARAYMKDAQVIILDEPTSALDAKAEKEVFDRFIGLTDGKTSIIISHRFSTVRQANRIVVLDEGKIIEEGSHEELLQKEGVYSDLFLLQAKGYQ